jgi:hypothetical protein
MPFMQDMSVRPAPIKTTWMGRVGVRGKYLIAAKAHQESLVLEHDHKFMTIPWRMIDTLAISITKEPVKEIFLKGGNYYKDYLFHFIWKPDPEGQQAILPI